MMKFRIGKQLMRRSCASSSVAPSLSTAAPVLAPKKKKNSLGNKIKMARSIDMPTLYHEGKSTRAIDGNTAAAHVAYAMTDVSFIYPISPSTSMGETVDAYANSGRKNVFGQKVRVHQMQSELGSAGALHGALSGGALCSTFTASQGLLLMIPNLYLCAGELLPAVFHVSARALARQSLSIFCDHSDVMAVRTTGTAMLCSADPQEVMDLALVSHLAAIKSSVPFLHFFDGQRTSSVIECVKPIAYSTMKSLLPSDEVDAFRQRGLNPQHPIMRGMGQDPQIYYQSTVAANKYYDALPAIVQETMDQVAMVTGRQYKLFEYYGDPQAERAMVIMASASKTAMETVDYLRAKGEKVGVLQVKLFRPFSVEHFLAQMPTSVKAVAVMDRTKEDLAPSLPLHADVVTAFNMAGMAKTVVGGNYGLGGKEFAPKHVKAVFDNLLEKVPKTHYTIGINDDVTHTSLPVGPAINTIDPGTTQALFFGLGSDGTVGANKAAAAIIGERTEFFSQGHFNYSSQKAGASTVSHVRFGPKPIRSEYEIEESPGADYVACHNTSFLAKFDMVSKAREGATFVVNCPANTIEELENIFPAKLRRKIAEKKVALYTIDAHAVAISVGLPPKRINQVMQATFFQLSDILPEAEAKMQLEAAIDRLYGKKSPDIVRMNKEALAAASDNLNKIEYPASWINAEDNAASTKTLNPSGSKYSKPIDEFSSVFLKNIDSRTGDDLAVSSFKAGGESPIGQSSFQKRALADAVPVWIPDNCTQCNLCAVVCPHAVVRPFLLDKKEMQTAPEGFLARKAKGGGLGGMNYTLQLAPFDCTGCQICVEMCPDDALVMKPQQFSMDNFNDHWEYSLNHVALKDDLMEKNSVKGSQFQLPLMEFSGACSGCGETPYVKLLTQMFGDRMVIANSSGCSSVWGGSYGMSPFIKNEKGQGPAWARSLFEDAAEYGFGMALSSVQRRDRLIGDVQELMEDVDDGIENISKELRTVLNAWLEIRDVAEKCNVLQPEIQRLLAAEPGGGDRLKAVRRGSDMLVAPSHWIIGGDGWAYDIGFGGLDHVMASGQDINILVLDTEGYSNTGAQISKATPKGATMKMASGGNSARKKDLGAIAMMHENTYVASVSLAADVNQTVKAFKEAEAYKGPSIIIAYATCVDWGHRAGDKAMVLQQTQAVDSGYWPLYRYNPDLVGKAEQTGFELDHKRVDDAAMQAFLGNENRFTSLRRSAPEHAKMLQETMVGEVNFRHETRKRKSMADEDLLEYLKKSMGESVATERVTVLYGSDTGNSEIVAKNFQFEFKRRGMKAKCIALNDYNISDLPDESKVLAIVATAGQGEMPKTAVKFWQEMETFLETAPADYLKDTKFAVFGMGDSSYVFFNEAANKIDGAFEKLGGERIMTLGMGDDQHPARFDTELDEWSPDFYDNIEAPEPPQELSAPTHLVEIIDSSHAKAQMAAEPFTPHGSKPVKMNVKRTTVPEGYERAIDHFEFDLRGSGLSYEQGDSLGLFPSNSKAQVDIGLEALGVAGDEILHIQPIDSNRSIPLPEAITARTLLTDILDIGGWPKRRFYEMLKLSATDPKEKEELQHLCTKEGKAEYVAYAEESYTYVELLQKFPSAKVSIGTLLDYVPDIKPRLYSIASSSRMRTDDECHLCVIKNEWNGTSGRDIVGLATRWLADDLNPDQGAIPLRAVVHPSAVTMPDTHKTPILMVALGTGIAPMRAFIEERACAKKDGEECAPMALFFGARNRQEYSYEAEFDAYQKDGVLEHIHLALSREQKEKIYVTHRLQQEKKLVYDLIHEGHGNIYLCGPGGNVPPQVRKAVVDSIMDCGGHTAEYAEQYVQEMQINGRYNVEAW